MTHSKPNKFNIRLSTLAKYAKALSHPARLAIVEKLAKQKSCICGEIVEVLPLAQSTVSQHLKSLKDAGLIKGEIEGLKSCYCLDDKAFEEFIRLSNSFFKQLEKSSNSKKCC